MNKNESILVISIFTIILLLIPTSLNLSEKNSNQIPTNNLPAGFVFMGIHKTKILLGNSLYNVTEGVYRIDNEDVYIDVLKTINSESIVENEKLQYKNSNYEPFTEIDINNQKVTQIKYHSTINGTQVPKYYIMWSTKDSVIRVGSSTEPQKLIEIAKIIE